MYRLPITFHNHLKLGETPVIYLVVHTHLGYRIYAKKELKGVFATQGTLGDGTALGNGTVLGGDDIITGLEKSARVISFGSFERTLTPKQSDILASYGGKQLQHTSMEMDNADRYFSRLIAKEPFIGRPVSIYAGFEADLQSEHIKFFTGIISELSVLSLMTIEADER